MHRRRCNFAQLWLGLLVFAGAAVGQLSQVTTEPELIPEPIPEPELTTEPDRTPEPELTREPILTPDPFRDETTPRPLAPLKLTTRCPSGSVFANGSCRKVFCPEGELYEGRCLQPVCPEGTVWRGRRCQEPGYVTTILEIENVFINEVRHTPGKLIPVNVNTVEYHTQSPELCNTTESTSEGTPRDTTARPTLPPPTPSQKPTRKRPTTTPMPPPPAELQSTPRPDPPAAEGDESGCCWIVTPRVCKQYGQKWVCFNRRYRRCDPKVCTNPLIYLKAPQIRYDPPIMVMPPNPPLEACMEPDCDGANVVDCSGCPHNRRETCSPYCYRYMCPRGACAFMDLQEYCAENSGEPGCTESHGCIWDWCSKECHK